MKRRRPPPSILSALHHREQHTHPYPPLYPTAYSALTPSSTFHAVQGVPQVTFRRFTPCGRYLVAFSGNCRDLILYRFETGGARALNPGQSQPDINFDTTAQRSTVGQSNESKRNRAPWLRSPNWAQPNTPPLADIAVQPSSNRAPAASTGLLQTLPIPIRGEDVAVPASAQQGQPHDPRQQLSGQQARRDVPMSDTCHFNRFFTLWHQVPVAQGAESMVPDFCLATPSGAHLILASFLYAEVRAEAGAEVPVVGGTGQNANIPAVGRLPVLESFTLSLVDTEKGTVVDRWVLRDDFVVLEEHRAVHMYGDMLCVLSRRFQELHILKVQESTGRFLVEWKIGRMCRPDDDMEINRARDREEVWRREERERESRLEADTRRPFRSASGGDAKAGSGLSAHARISRTPLVGPSSSRANERQRRARPVSAGLENDVRHDRHAQIGSVQAQAPPSETGLGGGKLKSGFYTGLMQRLLVFVYRKYHGDGKQSMFYRVVGQYSLLVMLKAQFLDDDHLLIRLGSQESSSKIEDLATSTCFFLVYCISSATVLNLFENSSTELLEIFHNHRDLFIGDDAVSATLHRPRSRRDTEPVSNGGSSSSQQQLSATGPRERAREFSWSHREGTRTAGYRMNLKRTRAELAVLPFSCQTRNVSPYLDRRLFSYNVDRISALDGTRALTHREVNTVKFISVETGRLQFKLSSGLSPVISAASRRGDGNRERINMPPIHRKKRALFLFHPFYPFVMSVEFSILQPTVYNFHVHGHV